MLCLWRTLVRVISINFNGIRSACSKDLLPRLAQQEADIVCVQEELKAAPQFERSIACNAPAIGIQWPIQGEPTLYTKNPQAKSLAEAERFA